jgi:hypothetical protein
MTVWGIRMLLLLQLLLPLLPLLLLMLRFGEAARIVRSQLSSAGDGDEARCLIADAMTGQFVLSHLFIELTRTRGMLQNTPLTPHASVDHRCAPALLSMRSQKDSVVSSFRRIGANDYKPPRKARVKLENLLHEEAAGKKTHLSADIMPISGGVQTGHIPLYSSYKLFVTENSQLMHPSKNDKWDLRL